MTNNKSLAVLELLGRILLAAIFIFAAIGKIENYGGTAAYMASQHVPVALLPLVIALELIAGFCVAAGLFTRWAAGALALFSLTAIIIFHRNFSTPADQIVTLAEVSFTGGLMILASKGAGCLSIDAKLRSQK